MNIGHEPETSCEGGKRNRELPPRKGEFADCNKLRRTNKPIFSNNNWDTYTRTLLDDEDMALVLNTGVLAYGMSGTGIPTSLNRITEK